jgi:4-amino-4-deoxy-L-arabinose transferase-like glycosyltransferase
MDSNEPKNETSPITSAAPASRWMALQKRTGLCCFILALVTLALLLPFLNKPFNIDDPLFIWTAKQIQKQPLNFYGFDVNWYGTATPMWDVQKNPPLASYYIAAVAGLFGWSEVALHAGFLLFAVAAILFTFLVARRFCETPLLAALIALLTPVFLVSSTTVMCDVMMLAFWMAGLWCWLKGLERQSSIAFVGAALFISAGVLTKYFAVALVPLLFLHSWLKLRRAGLWCVFLIVPIVVLVAFDAWTAKLYGRSLLNSAAEYTRSARQSIGISAWLKLMIAPAFLGGCLLPFLFFSRYIWRNVIVLAGAGWLALMLSGQLFFVNSLGECPLQIAGRGMIFLHMVPFVLVGLAVLHVAANDVKGSRDPDSILLAAWLGGTIYFAMFYNWSINGRTLLPALPVAAILLTRLIERFQRSRAHCDPAVHWIWPLTASGVVALLVTFGDYEFGRTTREMARRLSSVPRPEGATLWFHGHWGFQYYMEQGGAVPVDFQASQLKKADQVVLPEFHPGVYQNVSNATLSAQLQIPRRGIITSMDRFLGAGFYADGVGPLPFVFRPSQTGCRIYTMDEPLDYSASKK